MHVVVIIIIVHLLRTRATQAALPLHGGGLGGEDEAAHENEEESELHLCTSGEVQVERTEEAHRSPLGLLEAEKYPEQADLSAVAAANQIKVKSLVAHPRGGSMSDALSVRED
jgi:hypothetical protein